MMQVNITIVGERDPVRMHDSWYCQPYPTQDWLLFQLPLHAIGSLPILDAGLYLEATRLSATASTLELE